MKNIFLYHTALILFVVSSLPCCTSENTSDCHYSLTIQNNSTTDVYYYIWPDSTLGKADDPHFSVNINIYKCPSKQSKVDKLRDCWETDYFAKGFKLYAYIFDSHVVEMTNWDTIKINKEYLKRYDYSLQDIQLRNWTITYP